MFIGTPYLVIYAVDQTITFVRIEKFAINCAAYIKKFICMVPVSWNDFVTWQLRQPRTPFIHLI